MMNGEIEVQSRAGQGSEFIFTARFGLGRDLAARTLEPHRDLRGMKILVVDDNATCREILKGMLEPMSFKVTLARGGPGGVGPAPGRGFGRSLCPGPDGLENAGPGRAVRLKDDQTG